MKALFFLFFTTTLATRCTHDHQWAAFEASAECQPRDAVVALEPDSPDVLEVIPSSAIVPRCAGACHIGASSAHRCVPSIAGRETRRFDVILRKADDSIACSTVDVEAHSACDCGCEPDAALECNEKQDYDGHLCRCRCKDSDARVACLNDAERPRTWNEEHCACFCRLETLTECSSGFIFDAIERCECVRETETSMGAATVAVLIALSVIALLLFVLVVLLAYQLNKHAKLMNLYSNKMY